MDATCWKVVGLCGAAVSGLVVALGVVWRDYRAAMVALLAEKEAKVRLLEEFKRYVETRRKA